MLNLTPRYLGDVQVPLGTAWLLGACMESKGKQDLWINQEPGTITALRERALVQSVESSNRIEGVTVSNDRLRPLVLGHARPRDRSEEELIGYRKAIQWIHALKSAPALTPALIKRTHALAQGGSTGDAGQWKRTNNEIIELLPRGGSRVRFTPTAASEVEFEIENLCNQYELMIVEGAYHDLFLIATCIFDFLCVHPFRDGNGRVSRLLTTLLLQNSGFIVGRYVSLERIVEDRKEEYYEVLERCSHGWHEGKNDIVPWWNFFLGTLREAYRLFEEQMAEAIGGHAKTQRIRNVILQQSDAFTAAEIGAQVPDSSAQLVRKVLNNLKQEGHVQLTGKGRGARWRVVR